MNLHQLEAERLRSILVNMALNPRQRREITNRLRHHETELAKQPPAPAPVAEKGANDVK